MMAFSAAPSSAAFLNATASALTSAFPLAFRSMDVASLAIGQGRRFPLRWPGGRRSVSGSGGSSSLHSSAFSSKRLRSHFGNASSAVSAGSCFLILSLSVGRMEDSAPAMAKVDEASSFAEPACHDERWPARASRSGVSAGDPLQRRFLAGQRSLMTLVCEACLPRFHFLPIAGALPHFPTPQGQNQKARTPRDSGGCIAK